MSMLSRFATTGGAAPTYVDDVFSTYLYTGNGSTQTITNGVDLSGKGGMVWIKRRDSTENNFLFDTARGINAELNSNTTDASTNLLNSITAFNNNGFTLGGVTGVNTNLGIYTSWTFRKQPKFFDVVTYTGNGGGTQAINHSLGQTPGMVIVKTSSAISDWYVWHRSTNTGEFLQLNLTNAASSAGAVNVFGNNSATVNPTSTQFTVGSTLSQATNTYVAYLFAHDTAADGLIQCGSFATDGSGNATVTLNCEPQWVMFKESSTTGSWRIIDITRGMPVTGTNDSTLYANLNAAEGYTSLINPTATGFTIAGATASATYIYIAIRRPNKPPTSGTQVFQPTVYTGTNVDNRLVNTTIAPDMVWVRQRTDSVLTGMVVGDRMRGQPYLLTGDTAAEVNDADAFDAQIVSTVEYGTAFGAMNGFWCGNDATAKLNVNTGSNNHIAEAFKRAPGFFDIVCYTGMNSSLTVSHNLAAVPELMIVKRRGGARSWFVYDAATGNTKYQMLESTSVPTTASGAWNNTSPTASVFTVGTDASVNGSGNTLVAYLFASLPGISKVGTYTGNGGTAGTNGTSQTINCGFSAGARFVLIKRTDNTGDWYVFDSARGIVAASDPYLLLNSTAAEVTNVDAVDADNSGFIVNQTSGTDLNVTNATYIYLAIA